jgi:hypothetical protein
MLHPGSYPLLTNLGHVLDCKCGCADDGVVQDMVMDANCCVKGSTTIIADHGVAERMPDRFRRKFSFLEGLYHTMVSSIVDVYDTNLFLHA